MIELKGLADRPFTGNIRNFDRMIVELSPHMSEFDLDVCIEHMCKIESSKWDINPTVEDCKTQLAALLGKDRYQDIVDRWKQKNQKLLSVFGTMKYVYKDRRDAIRYDGLDPEDKEEDFEKVYV